jgi:tetratricopeptide (TPR) repeat protein
MVFFRQRNWLKAAETFRSGLNSRPGNVKTLFYLAETYFMEPDLDRARETIAQAASIAPNDAQVCQRYGEYLSATIESRKLGLGWLEKARRLNPSLARIDFDIGKTQFDLTDFRSAASSFETALKTNIADGEAAFLLAEAWANLGEWEKARDSYSNALTHGYTNGPACYGFGRALVETGAYEAAVEALQHALTLQPSLIKAHFQLARAYRQLGRMKEAQEQTRLFAAMTDRIDTSRELKTPEEEEAWKQVKPLLESNKEEQALKILTKLANTEDSESSDPHYLLGAMYYSLGRRAEAKRVLKIARVNAPKSSRVAAYLGMVTLSDGETAAAEDSFQSALALNSGETLALIGMGGLRYQQHRWSDAIEYLEKSRTADPDTLFLLCDAYYRVRQPQRALFTAEIVRALGNDRNPLLEDLEKLLAQHARDTAQ